MEYSKILLENNIKYLTHFTYIGNLKSILEHGILSVNYMKNHNISYQCSDKYRFDKQLNLISLSFEKINQKMLYKKKIMNKEELNTWIIFILDINLLDDSNITPYFCYKNAASINISEMFKNNKDKLSKTKTILDTINSKDPQKEILIEGNIHPKYIQKIVVSNMNDFDLVKYILHTSNINIPIICNSSMFNIH